MAILLIGHGANRMKFPVTAFDDMETARETLDDAHELLKRSPEKERVYDVHRFGDQTPMEAAYEVAEVLWDGCYFMGDPPHRYELIDTENELGLFYMSND